MSLPAIRNPIPDVVYPGDDAARRYLASGGWASTTLGDLAREAARRFGDRLAFVAPDRRVTFAELDARTERLGAALLALGLRPGERLLLQVGTTVETVELLLACFKAGVVPVCSVPQYREIEMSKLAELSDAVAHAVQADLGAFDLVDFARRLAARFPAIRHRIVVRGEGRGDSAGDASLESLVAGMPLAAARARLADVPVGCRDVLSFQLSGGTTGVPKIIPRFHGEYVAHAAFCARRFGYDTGEGASLWNLPLAHNAGQLYMLVPALLYGRTTYLQPKVDLPLFCDWIARHRVTHAASIGPVAPQLLAWPELARHDFSSLRSFATMNRADALEAALGVPAANLYGITEGLLLGSHPTDPPEARCGTNGASGCPDDEIRVLEFGTERELPPGEPGELCFRGPSSLRGYFRAPHATREALTADGFVRTGDMASAHRIAGRTYYRYEGRVRDNVNRGGEKIGCEEVEALVSRHPAVADAKLVAMPDEIYGEKGCVFLVLRRGQAAPDVPALAAFLVAQGLAKFKCPERIEVVDEFPVTRVGKLDKPALKRWIAERVAAERPAR